MQLASSVSESDYWNNRYNEKSDYWSLNNPNPTFVQLIKEKKFITSPNILIVGSGKGYDAKFAAESGLQVTGIDFSEAAVNSAIELCKELKNPPTFLQMNFFNLVESKFKFNCVYEYASICSFPNEKIEEFLQNIKNTLNKGGLFISVLFPLNDVGYQPPYSINILDFHKLARSYFQLVYFQRNIDSIKPRKGNEVLLVYKKD